MTTTTALRFPARPHASTWDAAVWIAQAALAFVFFWIGSLRAFLPLRDLEHRVGWINVWSSSLPVRTLGYVELTLALFVLVPSMTRFWPRAAPISAALLALCTAAAAVFHMIYGEAGHAAGAVCLTALAIFVAVGRAALAPIVPMSVRDEDPPHSPYPELAANPKV
ncbi:MAG TPA: DoxX family protein [Myxococcota bacterium]|jgi:hypothetical protein